ncbi:MAG: ROK family protein [Brevefilum sp.]
MKIIQSANEQKLILTSDEKTLIHQLLLSQTNTRKSLSEALGVSPAWITKTVKPLISQNLVGELGETENSGGRRAKLLGFSPDAGNVLGLDLGMNSIKIGLSDLNIQDVIIEEIPFEHQSEQCGSVVLDRIRSYLQGSGVILDKIRGIGICYPGPVDLLEENEKTDRSQREMYENFIIPALLEQFPEASIMADRDVCLMALGEKTFGKGQELQNFIYLNIGNRISAGIVCRGQIHRGNSGYAGEIGHIVVEEDGPLCHCGKSGCLEALAGGRAIGDQANQLAESGKSVLLSELSMQKGKDLSAIDVAEAASRGDISALDLIDRSGEYVGKVLTDLVSFFNPEFVFIGGGVSKIGHRFLKKIHQVVLREANPMTTRDLRIEYSRMSERAGVFGALKMAQCALFIERAQ